MMSLTFRRLGLRLNADLHILPYIAPLKQIDCGVYGSYYNIPKAIFYLLRGDFPLLP